MCIENIDAICEAANHVKQTQEDARLFEESYPQPDSNTSHACTLDMSVTHAEARMLHDMRIAAATKALRDLGLRGESYKLNPVPAVETLGEAQP